MSESEWLPIGRAVQLLTQPCGPFAAAGARQWLSNQMRDGVLAARCSTWWAQSNWALIDCPADATDFLIPAWYWNTDRTADGAHVIDASKGASLERTELHSAWETGRFSQVGTYGRVGGGAVARNLTIITSDVSVDREAFDRITRGMGIDATAKPQSSIAPSPPAPTTGPRLRSRGPEEKYDRVKALAALVAIAADRNIGGLGVDPRFPQRGDQARIEELLADIFLKMGQDPANSTIRGIAQIVSDAMDEHRDRRMMK